MQPTTENDHDPLSYQVGGSHYSKYKYQPIQLFADLQMDAFRANVIKYLARWRDKNGLEDLEKARHYLVVAEKEQKKRTKKAMDFINQLPEDEGWVLSSAISGRFHDALHWLDLLIEKAKRHPEMWKKAKKETEAESEESNE